MSRSSQHPSLLSLLVMALVIVSLGACRTTSTPGGTNWPRVNALPSKPPADLQTTAPTTVLRRGTDGFVYVVGGLPNNVATGTPFLARYSGDWPLSDLPRPPLAAGWVLKRYGRDAALVTLTYMLPDADVEGLEVSWDPGDAVEELGKGLTRVQSLQPSKTSDVRLSVGEDLGVQTGDIYAIVAPLGAIDDAQSVQLARRLLGICLVDSVESDTATCRLWRGSSMVPGRRHVAVNDSALFLEHSYGQAPRAGVIQIASIEGDQNHRVRDALRGVFDLYVSSFPLPNAEVEVIEQSFDATSDAFHRVSEDVEYLGKPQLLVGGSIVNRDGVDHLIVNYTGVGSPSGPGMIAAPPEGGVDLGPVAELAASGARSLAGVVWGTMLVYRGQTSEALMHLQLLLSDSNLQGPLRWHARDQYAMRWAALGMLEQALWLVLEDEAVALDDEDERAHLNALGTRVRLYDLLERPDRALDVSALYLKRRIDAATGPDAAAVVAAMGMHAEMLLNANRVDEARAVVQELKQRCAEGCGGDLFSMLSGVFWTIPEDQDALRQEILRDLVELATAGPSTEALATARLIQGLVALGEDRLDDSLIAFLEAERLYEELGSTPGLARIHYFMVLVQMARQEPQKAFELGIATIEENRSLGDFSGAAATYERLAMMYVSLDADSKPGPWLGAARDVLAASTQVALAAGNYGKAAEKLFGLGAFFLRLGALAESQNVLQRGVLFAIRSTRFDIAAMCHLWLGIIARDQNDAETFEDEIHRAQVMAEISGDPEVVKAIERVLNPPSEPETPTQLL